MTEWNEPARLSPYSGGVQKGPGKGLRTLFVLLVCLASVATGDDRQLFTQHTMTLANPFFEGRAPGSQGNRMAADYVQFYFEQAGLAPAFVAERTASDGTVVVAPSWRQSFTAGSTPVIERQAMRIETAGAARVLEPGRDFNPLGYTGSARVSGGLSVVGYSIVDGPGDYSSYGPSDRLDGRVALMFRYEPMHEEGNSRWSEAGWSDHAALHDKLHNASQRGAAAIILVHPPGVEGGQGLETLRSTRPRFGALDIPIVMLSQAEAQSVLLASSARTLVEWRREADASGGISHLGTQVKLDIEVSSRVNHTDNVGAVLAGRGALADEYVIIGAHYDHLGYGWFGSVSGEAGVLHPGADDNASGTAGLLLLAHRLTGAYRQADAADLRSVLFLAFSAEESGLIGSRHYIEHPTLSNSQISLMVNLDMIGRMRGESLEVGGTGTAEGLDGWLDPFIDDSGLNVTRIASGSGPSDHASFYGAGIPVLFFFTGTHEQYHSPRDTPELLNAAGALRIVGLIEQIVLGAAERRERFEFVSTGSRDGPGRTRSRVRVGIAPGSYAEGTGGVVVGRVSPGTSAAEAGLKEGDIMTTWNGVQLEDVMAWMPLLADHEPGDEVEVEIRRGEETLKLTMVLKSGERR